MLRGQSGRGANLARLLVIAAGSLLLANCASSKYGKDARWGVSASPRVVEPGQPVPKGGGTYRVGKPYVVGGQLYVPEDDRHYRAEGTASWYGDDFHGRLTANGEVFDMDGISAAHPTLPMPCYARVTNLRNGRSLIVRVNDRGPYVGNRLIDVSTKAAHLLGFREHGTTSVRVEYVGPAPLEGSDDRVLAATLREGAPAPAPSAVRLASARPFVPDFEEHRPAAIGGAADRSYDRPDAFGARLPTERPYGSRAGAMGRDGLDRPAIESEALLPPPPQARYGAAAGRAIPADPDTVMPPARGADPIASYISGRGIY